MTALDQKSTAAEGKPPPKKKQPSFKISIKDPIPERDIPNTIGIAMTAFTILVFSIAMQDICAKKDCSDQNHIEETLKPVRSMPILP